jgi:hypothetical protein
VFLAIVVSVGLLIVMARLMGVVIVPRFGHRASLGALEPARAKQPRAAPSRSA